MNILEEILETKKKELEYYSPQYINYIARRINLRDKVRPFKYALKKKGINIIAEIKKASPSKGVIREDFNLIKIAQIYDQNGAAAISVLTDREYFKGSIDYLLQIRPFTTVPLLRKDFIIDERQILEAVAYGADSYLLIAKILSRSDLRNLIKYGKDFDMEPLVEVHTYEEGLKALESGAKIIGINNRNLETFEVDINITKELAPKLKEEGAEIIVSESGLQTYEQLKDLKENYYVDAFLIGETLMRATDIGAKLRELLGKTKKAKEKEEKEESLKVDEKIHIKVGKAEEVADNSPEDNKLEDDKNSDGKSLDEKSEESVENKTKKAEEVANNSPEDKDNKLEDDKNSNDKSLDEKSEESVEIETEKAEEVVDNPPENKDNQSDNNKNSNDKALDKKSEENVEIETEKAEEVVDNPPEDNQSEDSKNSDDKSLDEKPEENTENKQIEGEKKEEKK